MTAAVNDWHCTSPENIQYTRFSLSYLIFVVKKILPENAENKGFLHNFFEKKNRRYTL